MGDRLITTNQIFELKELPKSIGVIGSGVIAVEIAQAMHRLGVKTDIFARSKKVGSLTSPNLQKLAQDELSKELNLHFETLPTEYNLTKNSVKLSYIDQSKSKTIEVDFVLAATGRKSLLNTLHLEKIDPRFDDLKQLPVDTQTKQLADLPIYIVGDAHTNTPIQHEAAHEGKLVAKYLFTNNQSPNVKTLIPLGIVFSSPEMASIGKNSKLLEKDNIQFVTGFVDYSKQGRALVNAKNQGAVEIYVDKNSRKVLGAELFCHEAEHLAHLLAWMVDESLTVDDLLDKPIITQPLLKVSEQL